MHEAIDLAGKTFGWLTVVSRVFVPGSRSAHWKCLCKCGAEVVTSSHRLRKGRVTSCGCKRVVVTRENQKRRIFELVASKTDEEMAISRVMTEYKGAARKRGLAFDILPAVFASLLRGDCYYCGVAPFSGFAPRSLRRGKVLLNGVDRINPQEGYVMGNVVSCCKHCNKAKLDRTPEAFLAHCQRVVAHHEQARLSAC